MHEDPVQMDIKCSGCKETLTEQKCPYCGLVNQSFHSHEKERKKKHQGQLEKISWELNREKKKVNGGMLFRNILFLLPTIFLLFIGLALALTNYVRDGIFFLIISIFLTITLATLNKKTKKRLREIDDKISELRHEQLDLFR